MNNEATLEAHRTIPTGLEVLKQVEPARPPVEATETPKTLEEYATAISEMNRICEEADKQSKQLGQKSIEAAIKTGEWLIEVKASGKISHGEWEKWCKDRGVKKPIYLRRMKMAESKVTHGSLFKSCSSLRQAEICCGARTAEKHDRPPENKDNGSIDEEIKVIPELILNDVRNKFEYIQRQYDILAKLDPELNTFLLGKGYSNDFPLLLQQWQSSLSDVLAYFNLPPVAPDVCVRCGHVREWDELFVPISAYHPLQHLQKFNLWCQQCEAAYDYDFEKKTFTQKHVFEDLPKAIKELTGNLNELKSLPVKKYTLAQKIDQLKTTTVAEPEIIAAAENNVWTPADINNEEETIAAIQQLSPKIVIVKNKADNELWDIYRHYVSSAVNNQPPTRNIKFLVVDDSQPTKPILGIGAISGDFFALGVRDEFIGWTKEQKESGKLKHTAVGSTIVATQPFGSNFLGGKLIAALITSHQIRDEWKRRYKDILVGMTTTSLFGLPSMYDRIKEWKRLGLSTGKVPIQPKLEIYRNWVEFIRESRSYEYNQMLTQDDDVSGPVNNSKGKIMAMIFKAAGLNLADFMHGHERGIYFSEFYENTRDFLCSKIPEGDLRMKPLFQETTEQITERWRKKAIKRYQNLKREGKLRVSKHSYSQLVSMDIEAAQGALVDDIEGDVEG